MTKTIMLIIGIIIGTILGAIAMALAVTFSHADNRANQMMQKQEEYYHD